MATLRLSVEPWISTKSLKRPESKKDLIMYREHFRVWIPVWEEFGSRFVNLCTRDLKSIYIIIKNHEMKIYNLFVHKNFKITLKAIISYGSAANNRNWYLLSKGWIFYRWGISQRQKRPTTVDQYFIYKKIWKITSKDHFILSWTLLGEEQTWQKSKSPRPHKNTWTWEFLDFLWDQMH